MMWWVAAALAVAGAAPYRGTAAPADAGTLHVRLRASTPAAGDTLTRSPMRVWLLFSEPVDPDVTALTLVAPGGSEQPLDPTRDPEDARALAAPLPALPDGGYRLVWATVSADGHRVSGSFPFYVARRHDADLIAPPPPSRARGATPLVAGVLRVLATGGLLALSGLLVFRAWILREPGPRVRRAIAVLAVVIPVVLALEVAAWAAGNAEAGLAAWPDALLAGPGRARAARAAFALLAGWALLLARRPGLAAVFAVAAVALGAATGHAAAIRPAWSVPANAVHLAAAALWLGGLLVLVLGGGDRERVVEDAGRVSGVALWAAVAAAATGAVQAVVLVPRLGMLVTSPYGLLVGGKIAGFAALLAFGAHHRFRLLPALRAGAAADRLRRSAAREVVVLVAVIVVAGFLAHTPPPDAGAVTAVLGGEP